MISFILLVTPTGKDRPRFWNGRVLTSKQTRLFEREVQACAQEYKPETLLSGPISITLRFVMKMPKRLKRVEPTVKPDLDNLMKAVADAFNGMFWKDDAQIVEANCRKIYDVSNPQPRIEVSIKELSNAAQ